MKPLDLKEDLLRRPERYSFFQAVRLLRLHVAPGEDCESFLREMLRVRPDLSLGFPGTDIVSIEEDENASGDPLYRMTTSFLGLYGASSPLPSFYTEDLFDEASEDRTVTREFLDVFNFPFYRLFFQIWTKYRWWMRLVDDRAADYWERLYSLIGLGIEEFRESLPEPSRFLRYIGLFTQFPRSALGLKTLLSDALGVSCIRIVSCVVCKIPIPSDQRCYIGAQGSSLGADCHLGQEIDDAMGKIRIVIGPLDAEVFRNLLPGGPLFNDIGMLARAYLFQPMEMELELVMKHQAIQTTHLGHGDWSAAGYTTWLCFDESMQEDASVLFAI